MTDRNNMPIFDQFVAAARAGEEVWYMTSDQIPEAKGACLYEPSPPDKPWTWISAPSLIDRLLEIAPQAVRVWEIYPSIS